MKTYEITREKLGNEKVLCYGYKALNYDCSTRPEEYAKIK